MIGEYDISWWDRLVSAARGDGGSAGWLWWLLPVLLAGMFALTVVAWMVVARRERERRRTAAFFSQGKSAGLEPAECTLLHLMAAEAKLAMPSAIFTWGRAFEDGAAALMQSRRVEHATAEDRGHIVVAITHIRKKLGLARGAGVSRGEGVPPSRPAGVSPACLAGILPASGEAGVTSSSVRANGAHHAGETPASREAPAPQGANRRRYPRVVTRRPCRIAPFAFETGGAMDAPEFVQATLVEIGGPGLKVNAPFAPVAGDRVMVMTQLNDGRAVQGMARVRRVGAAALAGARDIALEMIGLHPTEMAVLVGET